MKHDANCLLPIRLQNLQFLENLDFVHDRDLGELDNERLRIPWRCPSFTFCIVLETDASEKHDATENAKDRLLGGMICGTDALMSVPWLARSMRDTLQLLQGAHRVDSSRQVQVDGVDEKVPIVLIKQSLLQLVLRLGVQQALESGNAHVFSVSHVPGRQAALRENPVVTGTRVDFRAESGFCSSRDAHISEIGCTTALTDTLDVSQLHARQDGADRLGS